MKQDKKNPVGAPPKLKDGRATHLYLDSATIEKAKQIGGSTSAGIRIAVANFKSKQEI